MSSNQHKTFLLLHVGNDGEHKVDATVTFADDYSITGVELFRNGETLTCPDWLFQILADDEDLYMEILKR
jgi:hypothetical protein